MILKIDNSEVRIFGTVHVIPEGVDGRTSDILKLVDICDEFTFEHPFENLNIDSWRIGSPEARWTPSNLRTDLIALAETVDCTEDIIDGFKAWAFMLIYANCCLAKAGYDTQMGVDKYALGVARYHQIQVTYLEDSEDVFRNFDAAPLEEHIRQITEYIRNPNLPVVRLNGMIEGWLRRDESFFECALRELNAIAPISAKSNIEGRNANWLSEIVSAVQHGSRRTFFVGSLHLFGEDGLRNLLFRSGYNTVLQ